VKEIFAQHKAEIHGIIHCTGGAQTKVLHYIDNLHIVKNNLLPVPEIFQLISKESKTGWKEMYEVFNMGHRLEMYVPAALAPKLIDIAAQFEIDADIIGMVQSSNIKKLSIESEFGTFEY
jgi:phosphoribosylformylglycinamidine cyclo-ligase